MGPLSIAAAASVPAVFYLAYATTWPSSRFWGRVTWRGPRDSRGVALTFDDGPTPGSTERVLDALKQHNARATFFVIGQNVQRNPDLLRRIDAEGHLIGNHTFTHSYYSFCRGTRFWLREMRETDGLIESIIGKKPTFFRPPMGVKTCFVTAAAKRSGHRVITWSLRAIDGIPKPPERILQRFASVSGGDILVMHDGADPQVPHRDRTGAAKAVGPLIELIRSRSLEPVRLDELLV